MVLALKFTFLFLNLAKIHIFIPICTEEGGGSTGLGNIPKKHFFDCFPKCYCPNTLMYQTQLSHMFNCVNTGSTRLSKQRKFRIYVLDDFLGNCYNGSLFARYGNCCFGQLFAKSLFQTSLENCCCGTLFHPNFANNCCGSFCFPIFQFCHCKTVFFVNFVVVNHL